MFRRKERERLLEANIERLQEENQRLENQILRLEKEKRDIKRDLEEEHLENYRQHKQLLAIERLLDKPYGTYKDLIDSRNKAKKIIKIKELADCESH